MFTIITAFERVGFHDTKRVGQFKMKSDTPQADMLEEAARMFFLSDKDIIVLQHDGKSNGFEVEASHEEDAPNEIEYGFCPIKIRY